MSIKNNVLHGLPEHVQFCKKCVMSNQRPNSVVEFKNTGEEKKPTIYFGDDNICSACRYKEVKENDIDWQERKSELKILCNKYRSRNGSYDVIIPGSGGKDSCYAAHVLKHKYGVIHKLQDLLEKIMKHYQNGHMMVHLLVKHQAMIQKLY